MEKLVLDGKVFVKAANAADELGYTRDYIGQLCRGGKVDAHLVGRTWYVDQEQLRVHKKEKKRSSKTKAREQVRESIAASKAKDSDDKAYASRITYEPDEGELIPETKKLTVSSDSDDSKKTSKKSTTTKEKKKDKKAKDETPDYTVENEGEKVVMSGTLDVTDASEENGWFDEQATVFQTKVVKGKPDIEEPKKRSVKETKAISVTDEDGDKATTIKTHAGEPQRTSFEAKLAAQDEATAAEEKQQKKTRPAAQKHRHGAEKAQQAGTEAEKQHTVDKSNEKAAKKPAQWPAYLFLLTCVLLAGGAAVLEARWSVHVQADGGNAELDATEYVFDVETPKVFINDTIDRLF